MIVLTPEQKGKRDSSRGFKAIEKEFKLIVELYNEGYSSYEIAELLSTWPAIVRRILVKHGVILRSKMASRQLTVGRKKFSKGEAHHRWKGGRFVDKNGYVRLYMPEHPRADSRGYVKEHIFVLEKKLGRPLADGEISHHKDGNRSNNDPDNLEPKQSGEHARYHLSGEKNYKAKLTDVAVIEIRKNTQETGVSLAKKYGVSPTTISDAKTRRSWKHL